MLKKVRSGISESDMLLKEAFHKALKQHASIQHVFSWIDRMQIPLWLLS